MKIILFSFSVLLLGSCMTTANLDEIKKEVYNEKELLQQFEQKIDTLDKLRATKFAAGELDAATDSITEAYLRKLKDSINSQLNNFNVLINQHKNRAGTQQLLAHLNTARKNYNKELDNVIFLDDLFKASTFSRLNTAAFFGPGEYLLNDSSSVKASAIMQNIVEEAFNFSAKHSNKKLNAMFMVLGYADEVDISRGSALYNLLVNSAGLKNADRKRLNIELSNKRASSLKNVLKEKYNTMLTQEQRTTFPAFFAATGKGEALPAGNYTDYQAQDERRRVVLVYWSILPDLN